MIALSLIYIFLTFAALTVLCGMILRIGTLMADCPVNGAAIRVSAVSIATGFAAIGAGGVILIGALVPLLEGNLVALLAALGLASLCLGLGFTQAVATLRAVIPDAAPPETA